VPEGVALEDGRIVPVALIEAAPWVLGLLEAPDKADAYRWLEARRGAG